MKWDQIEFNLTPFLAKVVSLILSQVPNDEFPGF